MSIKATRIVRDSRDPAFKALHSPMPAALSGLMRSDLRGADQRTMSRDPLHESIVKLLVRIGMGYKAKTAVIAVAIARIFNAVDRPSQH